jgi:hypothetical protein
MGVPCALAQSHSVTTMGGQQSESPGAQVAVGVRNFTPLELPGAAQAIKSTIASTIITTNTIFFIRSPF